jgi:orotidine-5'-phosphate decarboxylase
MSIDKLHDKIRKMKNPSMLDLTAPFDAIPAHIQQGSGAENYAVFCRELMNGLKDSVPAVRFHFNAFALMGAQGLNTLSALLKEAQKLGYYVLLDAPGILTPEDAQMTANTIFGGEEYPCDGLLISPYIGSDAIKPFISYCKEDKDLFVVVRSANKTALELQDLMTGSRLVHTAAMDIVSRHGENIFGKNSYSRVCAAVSAGSPNSIRAIRNGYKFTYLLVDGLEYPSGNHKNCSLAFDRFGYGAVVCAGTSITAAWKENGTDGTDFVAQAVEAADRMKKNLTRYVTIL